MTPAGQGAGGVALSQNEIESLCTKAARGAGYSWGLAEEAGFATGWLAACGLDATGLLLALLTSGPGQDAAPRPTPGHWQSTGQRVLCPITLGAALTDCALLADGPFSQDTQLDPVAAPLLLVPFLTRAAQLRGRPLMVDWQTGVWQTGRLHITQCGAFDRIAAASWIGKPNLAMTIRAAPQSKPTALHFERSEILAIPIAVLDGLNMLALRTTVPATETSRRGAGSATPDTD